MAPIISRLPGLRHWRTTLAFGIAALTGALARAYPQYAAILDPLSQALLAAAGYLTADVTHVTPGPERTE